MRQLHERLADILSQLPEEVISQVESSGMKYIP